MLQIRRSCHTHAHSAKRFTHRAPDHAWIQEGQKNTHFRNQFGFQNKAPKLMDQYLRASSACTQKEKYCFVHAQSASFRFAVVFFDELRGKKRNFFRYLRYPSAKLDIGQVEVMAKVKEYVSKHGSEAWSFGGWGHSTSRPDQDKSIQPYLLSLSYSLAQVGSYESSSDFLFRNSSICRANKIEEIVADAMIRALKHRGKEDKISCVMEMYKKLEPEYASLEWGSAFVIGIPKYLAKIVYDSKSFGIPTGIPIDEAIATSHLSSRAFSGEEGGCQARLIICKEALDPNSGIDIVDVTDASEVERYCQGHTFVPAKEIELYRPYFTKESEKNEKRQIAKRKELDGTVKELARFVLL